MTGNIVHPIPASKDVRKILMELMSATTFGLGNPDSTAARSMMGLTPWGCAGKIKG